MRPERVYMGISGMRKEEFEFRDKLPSLRERISYTLSLYCHDQKIINLMVDDLLPLFRVSTKPQKEVNE